MHPSGEGGPVVSDVRADLGYVTPEQHQEPRPAVAPAAPPASPPPALGPGEYACRSCHKPTLVLHQDPRSELPDRSICGACQGLLNARRLRR
jgi:hypothetical protein